MSQCSSVLSSTTPGTRRAGRRARPWLCIRGLCLAAWESSSNPYLCCQPHSKFLLTREWPRREAQEHPRPVLGAPILMRGAPTAGHRAHWQHSATCLKSSSPCSSLKHRRQWGHCRSPWPLWVTPEHPPSAGRSSHWDPVPGLRPPAATGSEASVSKYRGDLLPV